MLRIVQIACCWIASIGFAAVPDFSGTWEMDRTRSDSAGPGSVSGTVTLRIKQTPGEVSIETRHPDGKTETLVYKLDRSWTEKPIQENGPFQWRAELSGSKLVTETHRNINRSTVTVREEMSMEANGKELHVDRTLVVQHGYQMQGAKNYSTGKDVFVKKDKE